MRRSTGTLLLLATVNGACALSHRGTGGDTGPDVTEIVAQGDHWIGPDSPGDDVPVIDAYDTGPIVDPGDAGDASTMVDNGVDVAPPMDTGVDVAPLVDTGVDAGGFTLDPGGIASIPGAYGTGTSSSHQSMHCGDTEVMTGAAGYYGSSMDSTATMNALGIHCATLAPDGTVSGDRLIAIQGYTVGSHFDTTCATSAPVVIGAFGKSSNVVNSLAFTCQSVADRLAGVTPTATIGWWGGTGGTTYGVFCPTGNLMHGVDFDVYNTNGHDRVSNLTFQCIPVHR